MLCAYRDTVSDRGCNLLAVLADPFCEVFVRVSEDYLNSFPSHVLNDISFYPPQRIKMKKPATFIFRVFI
jgi:hypothetical protein